MQKPIIGCWKHDFDKILLTHCKNRNCIWIYRWTHWETRWQPPQFRRVGSWPSNRTRVGGLGLLTTWTANLKTVQFGPRPGLPISQQFSLYPDPKWRCRTVANTSHDVAVVMCVWGFTMAGTIISAVPYCMSVSRKLSDVSPHPGFVSPSNLICYFRKLSMWCWTVLEIVPITQPGSSSSLSLPSSVSSSTSSSAPSSTSLQLPRSLRLSPIAFNISLNVFSGFLVVDLAFSAYLISSCYCIIAVSASSTRLLRPAVSRST